jgi:hypothetical protein
MGLQEILVFAAVVLSLAYLSVRVYRSLKSRSCGGACKGCSSIDFSKIDITKMKQG